MFCNACSCLHIDSIGNGLFDIVYTAFNLNYNALFSEMFVDMKVRSSTGRIRIMFVLIATAFSLAFPTFIIEDITNTTYQQELEKRIANRLNLAHTYYGNKIDNKKNEASSPFIIFSAHYDSVSSRVPYKVQRILLIIIKLIIFPYIGLSIFISIWLTLNILSVTYLNNFIIYLISILSLITLSAIIPIFLFIFTSNKSAGSIDNASGVSILIELPDAN